MKVKYNDIFEIPMEDSRQKAIASRNYVLEAFDKFEFSGKISKTKRGDNLVEGSLGT